MFQNVVIVIFLLLIGGVTIVMGVKFVRLRSRLAHWIKTPGQVVEKYVGERKILPGTSHENYRVYVRYSYSVGDQNYEGDVLNAVELLKGEHSMLEKQAIKKLNKISDEVTVHYNPENHNESFLKITSAWIPTICFIIGVPMVLGGLGMLLTLL